VASLAALALCLLAAPAYAQEPSVFVRLYWSSWMTGEVQHSPADPQGLFRQSDTLTGNIKSELEAIFLQHLGVSFSRQKMERHYTDPNAGCGTPPCVINEEAVHQSLNLTLYARQVAHDQFNLFAGGGAGYLDYNYGLNGVTQTQSEVYNNMSLARWFAGFEYTFQRIGFRVEVSRVTGNKAVLGQSADIAETFRYLTLVIPLN
jgi:hypothetical protein